MGDPGGPLWPFEPPRAAATPARRWLAVAAAVLGPGVGLHGLANAIHREWTRAAARFVLGALALAVFVAGVQELLDALFGGATGWLGLLLFGGGLYAYLWVSGIVWALRRRAPSPDPP